MEPRESIGVQIAMALLAIVFERRMNRRQRTGAELGSTGKGNIGRVSRRPEQTHDHAKRTKPLQASTLAIVVDLNALRSLFAGFSRHRESSCADRYQYFKAVQT